MEKKVEGEVGLFHVWADVSISLSQRVLETTRLLNTRVLVHLSSSREIYHHTEQGTASWQQCRDTTVRVN